MKAPDWSSRSLGSRFKHQIFYLLISKFGPRAAYPLLYLVVFYYSLCPKVYRRSRPYLSRRFPGGSLFVKWRHSFRLNLSFGLILLERAIMGLTGRMDFQDPEGGSEALKELLAEGRGLLILSAHVGAWQSGLGWLPGLSVPVNIVQRREEMDVDRHYFEHGQKLAAPKLIDASQPGPALATMSAALLAGEIVCVMADRARPEDSLTVTVPFLGQDIILPGAPFYLSARLQSPMALVFTSRSGRSRVAGKVWGRIRPENSGPEFFELPALAQKFIDGLEDFVAQHPYQYFNFYDQWSIEKHDDGNKKRA